MELKDTSTKTPDGGLTERKIGGPYVRAIFNPGSAQFQQILQGASRSILEIGCGETPRISWKPNPKDVWVGCDPAIKGKGESILVHRGARPSNNHTSLVVFPDIVADIPKFYPDVLIAVAPNQNEIVEGKIFDDQLEGFINPKKKQTFIVVLDKRTAESEGYQGGARGVIFGWMRTNGFVRNSENPIPEGFSPNSADLGSSNILMTFVRNP